MVVSEHAGAKARARKIRIVASPTLSTRKTSGESDLGAALQCGSRIETAREPTTQSLLLSVPVMVPMIVFILFRVRLLEQKIRRPLGCSGDVNRRPRESKPSGSHWPQVRVWL